MTTTTNTQTEYSYVDYVIVFPTIQIPYMNQIVRRDSQIVSFIQFCKSEGAIGLEVSVQGGSSWYEVL